MNTVDEIFGIFGQHGADAYFGERVSVTEHCLQAAWFAQQDGAPARLIVASLLHDIGHLIGGVADDHGRSTEDGQHERLGSTWLAGRFGIEISDPVRLHVAAKRYLCATDPGYFASLSRPSVHSLRLQGGPMSDTECAAFEREPYFREALLVRRCDDRAKVADLSIPRLQTYRELLETYAAAPA